MTGRQYPIRPVPDDDPRLTRGLALDVADVLKRYGYPEITSGADMIRLQETLYQFLYEGPR